MFKDLIIPQIARRFAFEEWGGTESVVWESARQLKKWGVQADILATKALSATATEQSEGIHIHRFDYQYPYLGLKPEGRLLLDKKGGNPFVPDLERHLLSLPRLDLLHSHGMQRVAGLVRRVARKRNLPYVVSFHGGHMELPSAEIAQMRSPVSGHFHFGRLLDPSYGTASALQDADALICVGYSEYLKTQAAFPSKRVIHLPNGVDPSRFSQVDAQRFRNHFGIPAELRLLLCVGRIDPQKNQAALLELLPKLPQNTGLVLVGPITDGAYKQTLERLIVDQHLQQRVWLIPGLKAADPLLADAYEAAEICVLPSRHEPFGIVVLEAWMRSKPVLVSDLGGLQHLVEHGKTGLRFASPQALFELAQGLLENQAFARALGAAGKQKALKSYTWDAIGQQLHGLYLGLIEENSHKKRRIA
ncbi:MAG: glycosyltransferase family 4 protein [Candidatus Sericytochromatia bacterium]